MNITNNCALSSDGQGRSVATDPLDLSKRLLTPSKCRQMLMCMYPPVYKFLVFGVSCMIMVPSHTWTHLDTHGQAHVHSTFQMAHDIVPISQIPHKNGYIHVSSFRNTMEQTRILRIVR